MSRSTVKKGNKMLWKIVDTPHWLLGSVHVLPMDITIPKWASSSYEGIERFVFEADYRDPSIGTVGLDKNGSHLKLPGAANLYNRASTLLADAGRTEPFDGLRPWRAAFHVISCLLPLSGFYHECGMDNLLRTRAEKDGLKIEFLETPTRAFDLLDLSCEQAVSGLAFFEHSIANIESGSGLAELRRIIKDWFASDLVDFTAITNEKRAQFPFIFEPLITQRNREWVPVAQKLISDNKPTLFVVGSLHTVGEGSFIDNLKRVGIRLSFINSFDA
jgi:uncharacterized protein YbaP (TraB family)